MTFYNVVVSCANQKNEVCSLLRKQFANVRTIAVTREQTAANTVAFNVKEEIDFEVNCIRLCGPTSFDLKVTFQKVKEFDELAGRFE